LEYSTWNLASILERKAFGIATLGLQLIALTNVDESSEIIYAAG
jgi:hypothetical protein